MPFGSIGWLVARQLSYSSSTPCLQTFSHSFATLVLWPVSGQPPCVMALLIITLLLIFAPRTVTESVSRPRLQVDSICNYTYYTLPPTALTFLLVLAESFCCCRLFSDIALKIAADVDICDEGYVGCISSIGVEVNSKLH